eukprot:691206-Amphidinium_carterae.1
MGSTDEYGTKADALYPTESGDVASPPARLGSQTTCAGSRPLVDDDVGLPIKRRIGFERQPRCLGHQNPQGQVSRAFHVLATLVKR